MEDIMRKNPRAVGAVMFLIGVALAVWLKHDYDTGSSVTEKGIIAVPVTLLYGTAIMARPRLMLLNGEFGAAPMVDKVTIILTVLVGVGLGFMLRHMVFGAWQ
jgi:ethanolamine transporter EutH